MKEHQKSPLKIYLKSFHVWVKSCEMICNSFKPAKLAKLFISTTEPSASADAVLLQDFNS